MDIQNIGLSLAAVGPEISRDPCIGNGLCGAVLVEDERTALLSGGLPYFDRHDLTGGGAVVERVIGFIDQIYCIQYTELRDAGSFVV